MKHSKRLLAFTMLFAISNSLIAQECIVALDALKGTYEGSCKYGRAFGEGKAFGIDSYTGEFKDGYPDGQGKYVWKNMNYYSGNMKKGLRDGKGEMHYLLADKDSAVVGYWKKDKYVGLYEKPFEVKAMSSRINKVNCRIADKDGEDININVSRITPGIAVINDVAIVSGNYYKFNSRTLSNMSTTRIQKVIFPLRIIITFNTGDTAEIIFYEKADYDVEVQVS